MTTPSVTETTPDSISTRTPAGEYGAAIKRLREAEAAECAARWTLRDATASRLEAEAAETAAATRLTIHLDRLGAV